LSSFLAAQAAGEAHRCVSPAAIGANGPNQVWSYDLVFDRCADGQQLKCLTVTDDFTTPRRDWRSTWTAAIAVSRGLGLAKSAANVNLKDY
jgi:hypothetical protein